jgi:hypothetical protein
MRWGGWNHELSSSTQGEHSKVMAIVGKWIVDNRMGNESSLGVKVNVKNRGMGRKEWKRTADSASVRIRCDFSFSFLSCESRAISEAWRRRFSTWRAGNCALSTSVRTVSVELSLVGHRCEAWVRSVKRQKNGLCCMSICEEKLLF